MGRCADSGVTSCPDGICSEEAPAGAVKDRRTRQFFTGRAQRDGSIAQLPRRAALNRNGFCRISIPLKTAKNRFPGAKLLNLNGLGLACPADSLAGRGVPKVAPNIPHTPAWL